jgi:GNAT superfamily N-acetyltransferase
MTIEIFTADRDQHAPQIRELFWEYLQWANVRLFEEFNIRFDIATMLEEDMKGLDIFMPPYGRLLLGCTNGHPAGTACLKKLAPGIGEIKRMYVRAESRKQGLGRALINRLVQDAQLIGYERIRLDSARFMKEAHQLYRAIGFQEVEAYEGSEVPIEFQHNWIFMEIQLSLPQGGASQ